MSNVQNFADDSVRASVIARLHGVWDSLAVGDMEEDMIGGLVAQVRQDVQGWDMSAEDFDDDFAVMLGWDGLDDHEEIWLEIVTDAARIWLAAHSVDIG